MNLFAFIVGVLFGIALFCFGIYFMCETEFQDKFKGCVLEGLGVLVVIASSISFRLDNKE